METVTARVCVREGRVLLRFGLFEQHGRGGRDPAAGDRAESCGPEEGSTAEGRPRGGGADTAEERGEPGGAGGGGRLGEAAGGAGVRGGGRAGGAAGGGEPLISVYLLKTTQKLTVLFFTRLFKSVTLRFAVWSLSETCYYCVNTCFL